MIYTSYDKPGSVPPELQAEKLEQDALEIQRRVLGHFSLATVDDVNDAMAAAQAALSGWRATPMEERVRSLKRVAALIEERRREADRLQAQIEQERQEGARHQAVRAG